MSGYAIDVRGLTKKFGERTVVDVLTAVEPCWSFEIVRNRASKRIEAEPRYRKCLHLYHYQIHPRFGFMSARIQTWLPFRIQICVNGREWLARTLERYPGIHGALSRPDPATRPAGKPTRSR